MTGCGMTTLIVATALFVCGESACQNCDKVSSWGLDPSEWSVEHPPCDATEIRLPPTGTTSIWTVSNMRNFVVYDDNREPLNGSNIYLYDLNTCVEYAITNRPWGDVSPCIWEHSVVFAGTANTAGKLEPVLFDMANLSFTRPISGLPGYGPLFNGRYLLYKALDKTTEEDSCRYATRLHLRDLSTGEELLLTERWQEVEEEASSLSPTHAAWVAWNGSERNVFFMDLETKDINHIQTTSEPDFSYTATWGDWVLWEDWRNENAEIYGWRISTSEEARITNNGVWNGRPTLRGGIACYRTGSLWDPTVGWDLMVRDMETGVERQVTQETNVGYKCGNVDSGWLVYLKQTMSNYTYVNSIHAVNLVVAGILDPSGEHVVPE
ncbi:MAG: hypothetical protein RBU30_13660 [Polyangia bacterium]|jgi:hypothetical protein|nr:hypothetical protein [Polyangia bacterium]